MMAKLGKGILGAPTGVIGNVMCYNRLGKSIIQSRSFPVDAYHRRWNLLKWQLANQLSVYWSYLSDAEKLSWLNSNPLGSSGYSNFVSFNLSVTYSRKLLNLSGGLFKFRPAWVGFVSFVVGSWSTRHFSVSFPSDSSIFNSLGQIRVWYYFLSPTHTSIAAAVTVPNVVGAVLDLPFPASVNNNYNAVYFVIQTVSPTAWYSSPMAPELNPLF